MKLLLALHCYTSRFAGGKEPALSRDEGAGKKGR